MEVEMEAKRERNGAHARDEERNSYCLASPAFPQYTAQVYRMCTLLPVALPSRPPFLYHGFARGG